MTFVGVEDDEWIIWLFKEGELVYQDTANIHYSPDNKEVIRANNGGELIGALGMATLFGTCEKCGWKGHTHFSIGDSDRDMAHFELEDTHTECTETIVTDEVHD
jgi:hypothetical protein